MQDTGPGRRVWEAADEAGRTEPASPPPVDADLVRRVRTRRFALDSDDPHRGH